MKRLLGSVLLAALLVPAAALTGRSQDAAPAATAATAAAPVGGAAASPAAPTDRVFLLDVKDARAKSGRVPNGYGALGLTKDQKERIYGVQAAYAERIKQLEAEIAQLKEEQLLQCESVLNDGQKAAIKQYNEQASARRAKN